MSKWAKRVEAQDKVTVMQLRKQFELSAIRKDWAVSKSGRIVLIYVLSDSSGASFTLNTNFVMRQWHKLLRFIGAYNMRLID